MMYIPFAPSNHYPKRTEQFGSLLQSVVYSINASIILADTARVLIYEHSTTKSNSQPQLPSRSTICTQNAFASPLLAGVTGQKNAPVTAKLPRTVERLNDRHGSASITRLSVSLEQSSAAENFDRIRREGREAFERVRVASIEDLEVPHSEILELPEAENSGRDQGSKTDTREPTEAQKDSEFNLIEARSGSTADESLRAKQTLTDLVALDGSHRRRVSEESEKTLVNTPGPLSRTPSTDGEKYLRIRRTRRSLNDQSATEFQEEAENTHHHAPKEIAVLLERASVRILNAHQENKRLKAEGVALQAQNAELRSLKETSEELNEAFEQRLLVETEEKADLEQWLTEDATEIHGLEQQLEAERSANYDLLNEIRQRDQQAATIQEQIKALGRYTFERMILLSHMLKHLGVNTRDNDHERISSQASELFGANEDTISAKFNTQASNALEKQQKAEAVERKEAQEIGEIEDRMADVLADGDFTTRGYNGMWVNMRTGDEGRKRVDGDLGDEDEDGWDPHWRLGMRTYYRFCEGLGRVEATKEELENAYT